MFCLCGCQQEVIPGKQYRKGHWLRGKKIAPSEFTPERRAKMSAAAKSRGFGTGPKTPEHVEKIAAAKRGKPNPHTPEWSVKVSAAKRGKKRAPFSEEWKRKIGLNRPAKEPSSLERIIAGVLDSKGILYQQQAPLGWYHVDFLLAGNIILECDGVYWHSRPKQIYLDKRRDTWLTRHGYTVLRLLEVDIRRDPVGLIESLCHHFK